MDLFRRIVIAPGLGLALTLAALAPGDAADFPARPVRIVVPSTPGGALDILSRMLAQKLPDRWGQPLVIDNRAGAGGIIGTEIVAKADPDGHTLLVVALGYAANPFLYEKLPYRTPQDFAPIGILATAPNVLVAHPSLAAHSVRELIAIAKAKPDSVVYASSGVGTSGHLAMELFKRMAEVQMVHVPYKGAGAATAAVVAGQVQVLNTALGAAFPHIRSGRLRALAVTGLKRADVAPDIPTAAESGLPGYVVDGWFAALAPAKTPARLVGRIHDEIARVYAMPDVAERIASMGFEAGRLTPQETVAFIAREMAMWQKVIREAGIKGE
ncbi:MAG TPA: tripartite tricarboxylate transporter substrate binding protein [Burkholderiales bacterium]|nr:tripartite tricarboxylate transporter substrate binding protein [Burkholderiales bacterium]